MAYVCPITRDPLDITPLGLRRTDLLLYPFIGGATPPIPDFLSGDARFQENAAYNSAQSLEIYRNFLNWLFATFDVEEHSFRVSLISRLRLKPGDRVLVTGCGLGEDLPIIADAIGPNGELYAQDLSKPMVLRAQHNFSSICTTITPNFSVGDALALPFSDGYFDAVFHFGGINLFGNMGMAVAEMARVTSESGRVVFGDEGIAPWLVDTEYAKIAVCNNPLWQSAVPLQFLPVNCSDVNCSWVLGNCFYLIDFAVSRSGPFMNIDVPHQGRRGGTARTRYFGQLEGVTLETKAKLLECAAKEEVSVHDWLEESIKSSITSRNNVAH